jgi:dipeptidyl aminopeptidase/acylaminoacyl peptidase
MKICHLLTAATLTFGVALGTPPASAQDDGPLIPREILFSNPSKASPRLSPDGSKLSYLAPVNGVLNVWVGPVNDPDAAQPVTSDRGRGIRIYFWAYTDQHILYLQDEDGDENGRLFCVDITSGRETALTPDTATAPGATEMHEVSARIQQVSHKYPRDVVIGLNDRDPRYHDLYVCNIDTGELVQLQENQGFLGFYTDDDFSVRFAMRLTPDGGNEILTMTDSGEWEPFTKIAMEDLFTTGIIDFDKSGEHVYMVDSRGRDTAAVTSVNLETGATQTLAKDRDADISGGVVMHPTAKTIHAVSSTYKRKDWQVIDKSVKGDFKYLRRLVDGELSILSQTLDDTQWIVAYEVDDGPVQYYRYDRGGQSAQFLFTDRPDLVELPLAKMHPEVIKSRDRQNRGGATSGASTRSTSGWPTAATRCSASTSAAPPASARSSSAPPTRSGAARCRRTCSTPSTGRSRRGSPTPSAWRSWAEATAGTRPWSGSRSPRTPLPAAWISSARRIS